ncbi:non-ribosomal peptide synthetase [Streptomyces orinoci]|uniref:Amino acid adenylation domain-containing protein n=1 Tax=Streptomyces orinoci TaxID=67339 RepID=A0ABV3K0N0_STRON|nr:amino acid adenylation domain-containing protein [Streptomyces orinoci]
MSSEEFWRRTLLEGGVTTVPRWTRTPVPGLAEHRGALPPGLAPGTTQLLAAHAKVLAALTGEPEVTTGYTVTSDGPALPCRLSVAPGSWHTLLTAVRRAEAELLTHRDFPVDKLRRRLGLARPPFETLLDPHGGELPEGTVFSLRVQDGSLLLRYRTEVLDAEAAARIAGYHLTALTLLHTTPDQEHQHQSLLSEAELRFQLEGLAGPRRPLPDRRFHELFEERVRRHPEAIAIEHGERRWTYRELNRRANRLARALLARGLRPEDVVAVVTERDLGWAAAVLAVFKAGGAYLPVEPHFPAGRIATMLSRAGCTLVLTEPGSTTTLNEALGSLPGVRTLLLETAWREDHAEDDPGVPVAADQLAYVYFTSGSTGEPKGAMCEHAGMLNHLYAKIADLGVEEGRVVAQTAPQCFDISLWQLVSALLAGGRTLLVEQEVILDVPRFVDRIAEGRVAVLQVVPSYLEAVLTHLERSPRQLPDLRCVSVTGEALKKELVQRWFAARPGIRLVNAYGLTETSDDTNHEVMDRPPAGDRVPLGPCVPNVHVYVVDERLRPVPLGAPGEIVFSGVCVGRGYVNDPERTKQSFLADPHRPGNRLYRSGDFGRWLPEGKLEFLGRRDSQVKLRGFRIETGDIENALLRVPGVRDGAVVIASAGGRNRQLVAFYAAPHALDPEDLRKRLASALPAYMVPAAFHWRQALPLTPNSKTDRKALTALAAQLATGETEFEAARTATERRLAAAWAKVLGVPEDRVGRLDHFFDRGGDSLSAVKLAIALDRAVTLKDITRHPVLAEQAQLLDGDSPQRPGLLQPLTRPAGPPAALLVCFPYAGGTAAGYQPLARALRGSGLAVYAVELPGHDPAAEGDPFAPLDQVVQRAAQEITALGNLPVLLWGHSSGAAPALATARALEGQGADVRRVFLGAQLLGDAATRRAAAERLAGLDDAEITKELSGQAGYPGPAEPDDHRAAHTGAAYRHDCTAAHRYFAALLDHPPTVRLSAPVTAVLAADDPHTPEAATRYLDWRLLADRVELHQLDHGGHYFPRTAPQGAARAVLSTLPS